MRFRPEIRLPIRELTLTRTMCTRFLPQQMPRPQDINALKTVGYSQNEDAVHFPEGFFSVPELERIMLRIKELRDLGNEGRRD